MELTCPSCEARYGVPDGAVGERGRQVSCSNCGHGWRAVPDAAPHAVPRQAPDGAASDTAQRPRTEAEAVQSVSAQIHALHPSDSRIAQLAEIREMIAQVQSDNGAAAAEARRHVAADAGSARDPRSDLRADPAVHAGAAAAPAAAPGVAEQRTELRRSGDAEETGEALHQDPLRRRMAEHDARAARERDERERLRRSMHRREAEPAAGSGGFLSGFLLVVLVAGVLLAAYVLRDDIVARAPESEPMMTRYAEVVDDLRVSIEEGYGRVRAWVIDIIADNA